MIDEKENLPLFTKVFYHMMRFITKFSIPILVVIIALTVFFAYQMFSLQIDSDVNSFAAGVEPNPYVETPLEKPDGEPLKYISTAEKDASGVHYGYMDRSEDEKLHASIPPQTGIKPDSYPDEYALLFTSDLIYTPEVLTLISSIKDQISSLDFVGPCLSAFDFVTVEKNGSRISVVPMSPLRDGETWNDESAGIFYERMMNDMVARGYLYSEDGSSILLYWRTDTYSTEEIELLNAIVDPLRDYGRVCEIGNGIIAERVSYYVGRDLGVLLVLCFIIILITYYHPFTHSITICSAKLKEHLTHLMN